MDEDGYFWFEGRADDVILSAGYRIGPTEVENTMMKHDSVAEVAVVGLPDQERGEIVAAFVVLADDAEKTDDLKADLQDFVATNLSKHEYPREIHFVNQLPKTASGKIQRFELRDEYAD
jgi:acetyl-CoA synthetase